MEKTLQARKIVSEAYKRFNKLIALIRPVPGNCNPVKFDDDVVYAAINDFEILLDEIKALVK